MVKKSEEEISLEIVKLQKKIEDSRHLHKMKELEYMRESDVIHHKMELEKLEKLKYRYKIGEDGFNKLINLGNLK